MSVSVAAVSGSASPNSLRVSGTGTGGGGVAAVSKATMLGWLVPGPLKTLISNTADNTAAFQALRNDPRLSVIATVRDPSGACTVPALFDMNTTSFLFGIAGDFVAIYELRFNPTPTT